MWTHKSENQDSMYYLALQCSLCYCRPALHMGALWRKLVSPPHSCFSSAEFLMKNSYNQDMFFLPVLLLTPFSSPVLGLYIAKLKKPGSLVLSTRTTPHTWTSAMFPCFEASFCNVTLHHNGRLSSDMPIQTRLSLCPLGATALFPSSIFFLHWKRTTMCLLAVCIICFRSSSLLTPSSSITSHRWCFCFTSILVSYQDPSKMLRNQMHPLHIALSLLELAQKSSSAPQNSPLEKFLTKTSRVPWKEIFYFLQTSSYHGGERVANEKLQFPLLNTWVMKGTSSGRKVGFRFGFLFFGG